MPKKETVLKDDVKNAKEKQDLKENLRMPAGAKKPRNTNK